MSGKPQFIEGMVSPHVNPLWADGIEEFPYDEVCASLDGVEPVADETAEKVTAAFTRMLKLVVAGPVNKHFARKAGMLVVALTWVTNPELLGQPMSMLQLCKLARLDYRAMNRLTSDFTRILRIQNRYQAHGRVARSRGVRHLQPTEQK